MIVASTSIDELLANVPVNKTIGENLIKAWSIINNPNYERICCSVSGGSDSDVMMDICVRCDKDRKIDYFWFDTGLEFQATKDHLLFLEQKYGVKISRFNSWEHGKSIPTSCKQYGQPFLSKMVSEYVGRLQRHGFKWEDRPFEELIKEYPKCKSALQWWCAEKGEGSHFNIDRNRYLKEFMIQNHPTFTVSNKCCEWSKKKIVHKMIASKDYQLSIDGVRKYEGGSRMDTYKNCYDVNSGGYDVYRPIFWYTQEDKECYENFFGIVHSKCYTEYGLRRTGCVGCPYSIKLQEELAATEQFEPKLYKAVSNVFKDSYEYTAKYRAYVKQMRLERKENRQMNIIEYLNGADIDFNKFST